MPVVDLLKYDSYGKTSIVNDWAGLYCFLRKYPWGQEVSSYVLVCVVFMLQGGGFVGIRIDLYFWCVVLSSRLLFVWGGVSPLFGRLFPSD